MKQYSADRIRNVGLFSHGGAGKTSLAEALLFDSGAIGRLGRVEDGTTTSDFDPDETKRHLSVSLAVLPLSWRDHKINLLDAPGFADFAGDIRAAMRVADAAIIVVDALIGCPPPRGRKPASSARRALVSSTDTASPTVPGAP